MNSESCIVRSTIYLSPSPFEHDALYRSPICIMHVRVHARLIRSGEEAMGALAARAYGKR